VGNPWELDEAGRMVTLENILPQMRSNPRDVRFSDLYKACDYYFGVEDMLEIHERIPEPIAV
jgi:hypothetical protein